MHSDLKYIYDEMVEYTSKEMLMGEEVNIRVEEDLYIKVYVRDDEGIQGQFKKPLMTIFFSGPGRLTVKFILMNNALHGYLAENFRLRHIEKSSFRVDFESLEEFEKFIGSL